MFVCTLVRGVVVCLSFLFWCAVPFAQNVTLVFPQIVDGEDISSEIILTNPASLEDRGTIFFKDGAGGALSLVIEETPQSSVAYAIPPGGVSKIETDGSGSTQAGYATVVSDNENTQITGNIVYVVNGFEVSVPSSPLSPHYHVFAERDSTLNSGVAFANPGDKDISISLQLLDQDGQIANGTLIDLQAGGQLARFINQIFDDDLPPGTSPLSKLDLGPFEVHSMV